MSWPPNKSWTSTKSQHGFRHFVAINYGGLGQERWVLLVSVLDGDSRLVIPWNDLQDSSKWISGWLPMTRDEGNPCLEDNTSRTVRQFNLQSTCAHPSIDSGLLIPSSTKSHRSWD